MKKKTTSVLHGMLCCFCILFFNYFGNAQKSILVKGTVVAFGSTIGLEGVRVQVKEKSLLAYSASNGSFSLLFLDKKKSILEFSLEGYMSKYIPLSFNDAIEIDLGKIELSLVENEEFVAPVIFINTDELTEDEIGGSNNVTGLLQSSKDVFLRAAAFSFGQARFKIRGYDSKEGTILINGIEMNKIFDGRPQWSNWGGLNAVFRNQTVSSGIAASEDSFGGLLGVTNFSTRASQYRPGYGISLAATNGSYKNRLMASHFTGLQENGWAFAVSASRRSAKNASFEGTSYNAWSSFLAIEKQINAKHSINFTSLFTPNRRGKSSPNTQEVYNLKGLKYNAYWGFQEGEKRNSRIKEILEPVFMLNHYWLKNESTTINSSVAYQFGHISNSRLGYYNVSSPDPTYYKNLPSYHLRFQDNLEYAGAFLSLKEFQKNGQVNWENLYKTNASTQAASYYLYEDKNEDRKIDFKVHIDKQITSHVNAVFGISYTKLSSLNYAKVLDVLGENGFLDLDGFAMGDAKQNNLNTFNRKVTVGDIFSYKYKLFSNRLKCFSKIEYSSNKVELTGTFGYQQISYQRKGLYKNGGYPNSSFGLGTAKIFKNLSLKANGLYKLSGRHLFSLNLGYLSTPPNLRSVFSNVRINQNYAPNLKSETKITGDVNYQYRAPGIKSRLTGYFTNYANITENTFVFAQGLRGDTSDFVAQVLTGIQKRHVGLEFGLEAALTSTIKVTGIAALGQFIYANNPNLYIESDQFKNSESDFGIAYLKNHKLGGTPQRAYSIGFEYRDPAYWWYSINANLMTHNHISVSPLLRTNNFYLDADGVPFINEETGIQIAQKEVEELLSQEKFKETFLLNLVGGKSWKINESYLGLFASINNLLGEVYKTGGFEQSRKANYEELKEDKELEYPLFGPKYWYGNGTSYYFILSFRF